MRLERLAVPQVPGAFNDNRFARSQAGQNLHALRSLLANANEPHLRFAADGSERADFPPGTPRHRGAQFLLDRLGELQPAGGRDLLGGLVIEAVTDRMEAASIPRSASSSSAASRMRSWVSLERS